MYDSFWVVSQPPPPLSTRLSIRVIKSHSQLSEISRLTTNTSASDT